MSCKVNGVSEFRTMDELKAFLNPTADYSKIDLGDSEWESTWPDFSYNTVKPTHKTRVDSFPIPDKVITSGPCTHVFHKGRKLATVRKSEFDRWDEEKGFAMAICKATYDKDTFEDLIKYAEEKETVIAFAKYAMGIPGYLELRRNGWKQYK